LSIESGLKLGNLKQRLRNFFCGTKKRKIVTSASAFSAVGLIVAAITVGIILSRGSAVVTSQREIKGLKGETYIHYNLDV
jgi:hypothetical protein